jgi:hypothetical protein
MADSNVPSYPDMFDSSQLSNPYSSMNAANFPMYNYYGMPTDAMGNRIGGYRPPAMPVPAQTPGTTINSSPNSSAFNTTLLNSMAQNLQPQTGGGRYSAGEGSIAGPASDAIIKMRTMGDGFSSLPGQAGQAQPGQQQSSTGIPSAGFNYLTALANPNKVVTPGVAAPPTSSQPGSIDLDSLIAQLRGGGMTPPQSQTGIVQGTAPSNGFLQTLAALRAGSPGAK